MGEDKTKHKTRQGKTWQRKETTRQEKIRQDKTEHTKRHIAGHNQLRQDKITKNQDKTENKTIWIRHSRRQGTRQDQTREERRKNI